MAIRFKLQLLILFLFLSLVVFAQEKPVEFGITAGYGYTTPKVKAEQGTAKPTSIGESNLHGFHVGPIVRLNINEQFGIHTGLLFNKFAGMNIDQSQLAQKKATGTWNQQKTSLNSFDMPIKAMYSLSLADDFYVLFLAGPNLNYSLSKITSTEHFVNRSLSRTDAGSNIYQSSSQFNAFDLQLGAGVGVQWLGVSIRAGYDWGVLNRTNIDKVSFRSNEFKVSLAYTF
jgi:hypothetical protein